MNISNKHVRVLIILAVALLYCCLMAFMLTCGADPASAWTGETWGPITRQQIVATADEMIDSWWTPNNSFTMQRIQGDPNSEITFYKGSWYQGLPYFATNYLPQYDWNEFITWVNNTEGGTYTDGYGNDCSGFVSICWRLPDRYVTRRFEEELGTYWDSLGPVGSAQSVALLPGDALNRAGVHIILFNRYVSGGIESLEQTRELSMPGARRRTWTWSQLADYRPIRRKQIIDDDVQPPSVPTNVQATAKSASSIKVTWTSSTDNIGVTAYKIFRNGVQVGTAISSHAGWKFERGSAINNNGQIAGWGRNPQGLTEAFLLTPTETNSSYELTPLGVLGGYSTSRARGINNQGHVVGNSSSADQQRAFLRKDGVMQNLGTLGGPNSIAHGINDSGQVVGWSTQSDGTWRAFRWQDGTMVALDHIAIEYTGNPGTYWWTTAGGAYAINNSGQVAGTAYWKNSGYSGDWTYAAKWSGAGTGGESLGTREAFGINNLGDVTGWYAMVTGTGSAASAKKACIWNADGTRMDIGTLGGIESWAYAINDNRQAVGLSNTSAGTLRAFLWQNDSMQSLGVLSDHNYSWATGINDSGHIVGASQMDENTPGRAFLWKDGIGMVDLNHLPSCSYLDTHLSADTTYSYTVSAYDLAGNESAQSSPAAVATTMSAIGIAGVKELPDASTVGLVSQVVTAVFDGYLYIGEVDRHSGIRVVPVEMPEGIDVGSAVDVGGTLQTVDGERRITGATIIF